MARRNVKRRRQEKELRDKGYVECYYCDELVKPRALRCPHCGKLFSAGKQVIVMGITIAVILAALTVYYWPSADSNIPASELPAVISTYPTGSSVQATSPITVTFNKAMNQNSVEASFSISPNVPGSFSWSGTSLRFEPSSQLSEGTMYTVTIGETAADIQDNHMECGAYQWFFTTAGGASTGTRRDIGTGENDFWSRSTDHPSWVVSAVQSKPVMILTHSEGCAPCITQTGICESVDSRYSDSITYFDITSGVDEPQATDCFGAYDPDGPPSYIPLTTVLTMGPNNQIIWHSWEGVIDEATLSGWIDDAVSYHQDY